MKADDLRKMTDDELNRELDGLRKTIFDLKTKKITDVVENSALIRQTRRDIARVLTIMNERKQQVNASEKGKV